MRLALIVHPERDEAHQLCIRLIEGAADRGIGVIAGGGEVSHLDGVVDAEPATADLIVSLGGDGTVLEAVRLALEVNLPVLGINVGRLGFLAEIEPASIDAALDSLAAQTWTEQPRMTLKAAIEGGPVVTGLNDVVMSKRLGPRLTSIGLDVDGEPFRTFRADALVVASPTGSTAYSFSAGGPVVSPSLEAILLSAVAPHSWFSRSIVFAAETVLRFTAVGDRPVGVDVDAGELGELAAGQSVTVTRGDKPVRFVSLGGPTFPHILQHKLGLES